MEEKEFLVQRSVRADAIPQVVLVEVVVVVAIAVVAVVVYLRGSIDTHSTDTVP